MSTPVTKHTTVQWLKVGATLFHHTKPLAWRQFVSCFGLAVKLVDKVWILVCKKYPSRPFASKHLLWTLYFLKLGMKSWDNLALVLSTSHVTLRKYLGLVICHLNQALPPVCLLFELHSLFSFAFNQDLKIGLLLYLLVWWIQHLLRFPHPIFVLGSTITKTSTNMDYHIR